MVHLVSMLLASALHASMAPPRAASRCAVPRMQTWPFGEKKGQGPSQFEMERVSPNGERVVRATKLPRLPKAAPQSSVADMDTQFTRRAVFLGLFVGTAATAPGIIGGSSAPKAEDAPLRTEDLSDGDAVTRPGLENALLDILQTGPLDARDDATVRDYVTALEQRGGSQIMASAPMGRWVLPWVGGWERVWTSTSEDDYFGGPTLTTYSLSTDSAGAPSLRGGSTPFSLSSVRHFVYGPGDKGMTVEYLYSQPNNASQKLLLSRIGSVSNLGGNFFEVDFPQPLEGFPVARDLKGKEALAAGGAQTP